jgi:hypothetical protein
MKKGWWILFLAVVIGGFAVHGFWNGYHRTCSIVAGVVSIGLGLLRFLFYGAWAPPEDKARSDRSVL